MTNDSSKPIQKIDFWGMSEYEKAKFLRDKVLPALKDAVMKGTDRNHRQ